MVSLKKSILMVPVGLVKDFRPLGHSGQPRLQAVVGSTEMESGNPSMKGRPVDLLNW
jgi:hypothetical protein